MTDHLITPPPELLAQWIEEWINVHGPDKEGIDYVVAQAAQWGADQALKAARIEPTDEQIMECYRKAYYAHKDRQGPAAQVAALRAVLAKWGRQ